MRKTLKNALAAGLLAVLAVFSGSCETPPQEAISAPLTSPAEEPQTQTTAERITEPTEPETDGLTAEETAAEETTAEVPVTTTPVTTVPVTSAPAVKKELPVITVRVGGADISVNSVADVQEEQTISIFAGHSSGISEIQYISGSEAVKKISGGSTSLWYNGVGTVDLRVSATAADGASSGFVTYKLNVTPKPEQQPPAEPPREDFIDFMFANAVEIPGSGEKVEPPPPGRGEGLQHKIVPLSETVPEPYAYFGDIVILGDSVTLGFEAFKKRISFNGEAVLGGLTVVSSGSYGVYQASRQIGPDTVHPRIGGTQYYPEDIIAGLEAKNVLICLGLNDTWLGVDGYIEHYSVLITRILEKSPDKNIVVMSVTPVTKNQTKLSNGRISNMNNALIGFAADNGYMFIDSGAALRDGDNFLYGALSSDDYCHLTLAAYNRLVEYLLYHPIKTEQE